MGAFIYAAKLQNETIADVCKRLRKSLDSLTRKGLQIAVTIDRPSFSLFVYGKRHNTANQIVHYNENEFAVVVGTFIYRERLGVAALSLLYQDFQTDREVFSHLLGSFAVIISHSDHLYCFNDFNGTYHIFSDLNMQVVSSSMLAVFESVSSPRISKQAVYEYLLDGATYGTDTPILQVRRLPHASVHQLQPKLSSFPKIVAPQEMPRSFDDQVQAAVSDLVEYFRVLHAHFADKLLIAFSGGYDSRLLLAAAMNIGFQPQTFVGGYGGSGDVRVAMAITAATGIALVHQDPTRHRKVSVDDFPQIVDKQFHYHDGLGIRGAISDGAEYEFRHERLRGGLLELNGGGGEHYRDFWQLRRGAINIRDFVRKAVAFKSLDTQAFLTQEFQLEEYIELLTQKIQTLLQMSNRRLSEEQVSVLYTLFRSCYFAGPSNKEMNLIGYALLPFAETRHTLRSYRIPLQYRRYGRFEAAMINQLSPQLASFPSIYGYNFRDPISFARRRKADVLRWSREALPPPLVFAVYKRLKRERLRTARPYYHGNDYLARIVDLQNLRIAEYLDLEKIRKLDDPNILSRALTLELLLCRL